jgi:hypothetical protein
VCLVWADTAAGDALINEAFSTEYCYTETKILPVSEHHSFARFYVPSPRIAWQKRLYITAPASAIGGPATRCQCQIDLAFKLTRMDSNSDLVDTLITGGNSKKETDKYEKYQ